MCPQWKCPMSLHMTFCKTLEPSESSHSNLPQYYSSTNKLISNTRLANRLQPQQPSLWHVNTSNCMSLISSSSFKLSWWSLSSPWLYYTTSAYDNMMNMGVVKQALITLPKLYCHNHHNMQFDANLFILILVQEINHCIELTNTTYLLFTSQGLNPSRKNLYNS